MNILLLGSGGREHALARKISQSSHCGKLYIAPGNAGTAGEGENVNLAVTDFEAQKTFCLENKIDMVVVGPEEPLVRGVYDYFAADAQLQHIKVVGPSAQAAKLEGSKSFAKAFMQKYGIPTASYFRFTASDIDTARAYVDTHTLPVVIKADGLAAGKGVVIAETREQALSVLDDMLLKQQFGEASSSVVIEQFLKGIEVSVFALTDGHTYKIIGHAKDYKRVGEGDTGPNTGGMGCISPVPFMDRAFMEKVEEKIVKPTIEGIRAEGYDYKGFVFFGLINVQGEPYVIEYNCRMGDPETEVVMPRLENDLVELFLSLYDGSLDSAAIRYAPGSFATVVAVSRGYPGDYPKGLPIRGLGMAAEDTTIYHAGTRQQDDIVLTSGGRVLAVTSRGATLQEAVQKSLATLEQVQYDGIYYRRDIGFEFAS